MGDSLELHGPLLHVVEPPAIGQSIESGATSALSETNVWVTVWPEPATESILRWCRRTENGPINTLAENQAAVRFPAVDEKQELLVFLAAGLRLTVITAGTTVA